MLLLSSLNLWLFGSPNYGPSFRPPPLKTADAGTQLGESNVENAHLSRGNFGIFQSSQMTFYLDIDVVTTEEWSSTTFRQLEALVRIGVAAIRSIIS